MNIGSPQITTVDESSVAKFSVEVDWWDKDGVARWLHRYNEVRVPYIRDALCRKFDRDPTRPDCLAGLRVLEVGCGAGVLCESLAQLGATVVGVDPTSRAIEKAKDHARSSGVEVEYRCATAETLVREGERFHAVVSMEVIEHVSEWRVFLRQCSELTQPGGLLIVSTINRTKKSYLYAIFLAEYVLRLLPRGSHQWSWFIRPSEIEATLTSNEMKTLDVTGVEFDIFKKKLYPSRRCDVNFMLTAEAAAV